MKKREITRFTLYVLLIVLLNIALQNIFFRIDLTSTRSFSLTNASKQMVSELKEPLTVKVYITENLPQPYNNLEQNIQDALQEYALAGNKNFNYDIFNIKNLDDEKAESSNEYEKDAQSYGINPIQIQKVDQSEINLTSAYMGIAFIHADMIETIPVLNPNENIEYIITSTVVKMQQKTSSLLSLEEDIKMKLYLSSDIFQIANELKDYPSKLERVAKELNKDNYNRISYEWIESDDAARAEAGKYGIKPFQFKNNLGEVKEYYASAVLAYKDQYTSFDAIGRGLFGYSIQEPSEIKDQLEGAIERIIGIGSKIAWLQDHGTISLYSRGQNQNGEPSVSALANLVSNRYQLNQASVVNELLPEDADTLIIARPQPMSQFTDWELYQIDQFLMKGKNVAVFMDGFMEYYSQQSMQGQPPAYIPRNTGLEKLLDHYGLSVKKAYIYDEDCFHNQQQDQSGIRDIPIYFAPKINSEKINKDLLYTKGIEEMIALNASPVEIKEELIEGCKAEVLYSSSDTSWIEEEQSSLNTYNPMMIMPPPDDNRASYPMAAILEGSFTSYFSDKGVPERPEPEKPEDEENEEYLIKLDQVSREENMIKSTENGKLFVFGSYMNLADNLIDQNGNSPAAILMMNIIDYMNGNGDFALMRQKGMSYKPLKDIPPSAKTIIKTINIAIVPLLVIVASIIVWLRRKQRQKKLLATFTEANHG